MTNRLQLLLLLASLLCAGGAQAEEKAGKRELAPVPASEAVVTHGPYEQGDCGACHKSSDPKSPGPVLKAGNELCFDCHDEFKGKASKQMKHPAGGTCTGCHNPHSSKKKSLLH